jgi:hypothetical protein
MAFSWIFLHLLPEFVQALFSLALLRAVLLLLLSFPLLL